MAPQSTSTTYVTNTGKSSRSIAWAPSVQQQQEARIIKDIDMETTKCFAQAIDALTLPFHSYNFTKTNNNISKPNYSSMVQMVVDPNNNSKSWVRCDKEPSTAYDGIETVDQMMRKAIKMFGDRKTLGFRKIIEKDTVQKKKKLSSDLTWMTYKEFGTKLDNIVDGFSSLGIKSGDIVVIFMETRLEWFLTAQALARMGATMATLYATLGDEGVVHGLNEVKSTHIITSNDLLPKLGKLAKDLPHLKTLVVVRDEVGGQRESFSVSSVVNSKTGTQMTMIPFEELEKKSRNNNTSGNKKVIPPKKDDTYMLMYTSGSTGAPKAVIHTHESVVAGIRVLCQLFSNQRFSSNAQYICYLPLAHIMENYASHTFLLMGQGVAFGSPFTLLDSSPGLMKGSLCDAVVIKPEVMVGVPLMFDRVRKTVESVVSSKGSLFKHTFDYVMKYKRKQNNKGHKTPIIDKIFVSKTKKLFGGRLTTIISGGAALAPDTQAFIQSCLGIEALIIYGATEVAGSASMIRGDTALGTTGIPMYGTTIKLVNWEEGNYRVTDKPNPRGEILIGGKSTAMGYFMNEEATKESFFTDSNGCRYWASGDIGEVLPDGSLKIIDRKKDLVKLSFGEYISLGKVCNLCSSLLYSFVSNILCLYY